MIRLRAAAAAYDAAMMMLPLPLSLFITLMIIFAMIFYAISPIRCHTMPAAPAAIRFRHAICYACYFADADDYYYAPPAPLRALPLLAGC